MKLHRFSAQILLPAALLVSLAAGSDCCLKAVNGRVAAFDDTGACVRVYDTPLSSLRRQDRELLENGLYFSTFPELTRACEDFCS